MNLYNFTTWMKKAVAVFGLLTCTANPSGASHFQASFDCEKASAPIETLICSDESLASLDRELALLFSNVRNAIEDEATRLEQLKEQRAWLKSRLSTCEIPRSGKLEGDTAAMRQCLINEMRKRNDSLAETLKKSIPETPAAAPFDSVVAAETQELKIVRISPKGDDVDKREQIVFQFNRPVVPIGEMERKAEKIPIDIIPAAKCQWRWLNRSALACNLEEKDYLSLSTRYQVVVNPGIMDENGVTIQSPVKHEFTTARPKILSERLYEWIPEVTSEQLENVLASIKGWNGPGIPLIDVRFNQQVTKDSVERSLSIEVKGEHYPVVAFAPAYNVPSREILQISLDKRNFWINTVQTRNDEPVQTADHQEVARLNWVVKPSRSLPEDTEYSIKIKPGLVSAFGPLQGIEDRIVSKGWTLPPFSFLGFSCTKNDDQVAFIPVGEEIKDKCSVFNNVHLVFSSPVYGRQFNTSDLLSPAPKYSSYNWYTSPLEELQHSGNYFETINHSQKRHYLIPLPKVLKNSTSYTVKLHGGSSNSQDDAACLKDVFDRCLPADISATFVMDRYRPTFHWSGEPAVLEKNLETDVSLYTANIDKAVFEGETFSTQKGIQPFSQEIKLAAALDKYERSSFGVRQLLNNSSGLIDAKISLQPETAYQAGNKRFIAQVTPFHVHTKIGEDSGLVWVTDLTTGLPVADAEISVIEGSIFEKDTSKNKELATTRTNGDGIATIPGETIFSSTESKNRSLLVKKDNDIAHLSLERYGSFYSNQGRRSFLNGSISAWGMTAEGVYRPGKIVDYKIFVREMHTEGVRLSKLTSFELEIHDQSGRVAEKKDITLSEFGSYSGQFAVGKNGTSGRYKVYLRSKSPFLFLYAMDFLVTDYVPSSFKVQTTLNQQVYQFKDEVEVDTAATLHSGGPFTGATNRYTATIIGKPFSSNYPATKDFWFDSPWCIPFDGCGRISIPLSDYNLDQEGKTQAHFTADGGRIGFGTLEVESAVEDDRGKNIANMAKAVYFGVDRFVGLKTEDYTYSVGKPVKIRFVVTDGEGIPVEGVPIAIESSGQRQMGYLAKGAGNTYVARTHTEQQKSANNLQLVSGKTAGDFEIIFTSVGKNSVTATISDSAGRTHVTKIDLWVTGPDPVHWDKTKDNTLDFVTKKTTYQVGEIATILVKNPFPKAKALVTVERMGIVKSWVETLDHSLVPISFKVTEDMVPNFALSVVLFSPRIDERKVDTNADSNLSGNRTDFDLGRPEWRMGYVQMEAFGTKHSLDVGINTDTDTYRPGQKVQVSVQVRSKDGSPTGPTELAVVVLDEAVFDLIKGGMDYFDPKKGFYGAPIDSVENFNILQKLITHSPAAPTILKGDDPGGDGAMSERMRSNLKSLAYWNPALTADQTGKAEFAFTAPDNLTGWRILVLAADKKNHLEVGSKNIKVNRLTEIQPAMPNQVVEGDKFTAAFTVMNRTTESRSITVNIAAQGNLESQDNTSYSQIVVEPFERQIVKMTMTAGKVPVDKNIEKGWIEFKVRAGDEVDFDAVTHQLAVNKKINLDIGANYGTTSQPLAEEPLLFPEQIRPDIGDVTVTLSPTLIGDLEGAFRFLKGYPYSCWEQKLSRAVMAASYLSLRKHLSAELIWDEAPKTITETFDAAKDFQAPNGGIGFFKNENDRVDPYLSAYTALCFSFLDSMGHPVPKAVEEKLHNYLKELLRTDVVPTFYSKGMASSARAVALAALARAKKMDSDMLKRHMEHLEQMDMFGKSQMLEAALRLGKQEESVATITDKILGSSNETGGRVTFNETLDDGYNRMLSSVPRTNCAVLSSLLLLGDTKDGAEKLQDLPFRLARTIRTMRGQKDHFENTQENVICVNSLIDFAKRYEKVEPNMEVSVDLAGEQTGSSRFTSFQDKPLVLVRPIDATDPGKRKIVKIEKEGDGRIYYTTVMRYAALADQEKSVNAGMQISREYHVEDRATGGWRLLGRHDTIKRGDVVRVDLYLHLPSARTQVVVDDPLPGALESVNTELATASQVDADKAKANFAGGSLWFQFRDWHEYSYSFWSFNHRELLHDASRFYAEYLPPGNYHLSFSAQAIAEGEFVTQPVFAGEMYDADIYGKGVSGTLHVLP